VITQMMAKNVNIMCWTRLQMLTAIVFFLDVYAAKAKVGLKTV